MHLLTKNLGGLALGLTAILISAVCHAEISVRWLGAKNSKNYFPPRIQGTINVKPGVVTSTRPACYRYAYTSVTGGIFDLFQRDTCGGERSQLTHNAAGGKIIVALDAKGDFRGLTIAALEMQTRPVETRIRFLNERGEDAERAVTLERDPEGWIRFFPMQAVFDSDGGVLLGGGRERSEYGAVSLIRWRGGEIYNRDWSNVTFDIHPSDERSSAYYKKVVFSPDVFGRLQILDLATGAVSLLMESEGAVEGVEGYAPTISRDGVLAYLRREGLEDHLWTCRLEAASSAGPYYCRNASRMPLEGTQLDPAWTFDGGKLFFTQCTRASSASMSSMETLAGCVISMSNPDGSLVEHLTSDTDVGVYALPLPPQLPKIPSEYLQDIKTPPAVPRLPSR